jgi:hypothetical protein
MRLVRFASVIALILLAAGLRAATDGAATPRAKVSASGDAKYPTWTVTAWGKTQQDGNEVALDKAVKELDDYLARQDPPVHWKPSRDWVAKNLVKSRHEEVKEFKDEELLKKGYDVTLNVEVGPKQHREILENDRQERVQQRELLLARVLAGVVALLLAVVGYLRLDEATKGYYTLWLRLGALGLVGGVAAALFVLG